MTEVVANLTNAFTLAFVVASMFGLGLGLTLKEVVAPLKDARLVISSLAANFVIVPAVAYLVTRLFPADADLKTGIVLLSAVAGAPLAIKASQLARGDMRFAASLVALHEAHPLNVRRGCPPSARHAPPPRSTRPRPATRTT